MLGNHAPSDDKKFQQPSALGGGCCGASTLPMENGGVCTTSPGSPPFASLSSHFIPQQNCIRHQRVPVSRAWVTRAVSHLP